MFHLAYFYYCGVIDTKYGSCRDAQILPKVFCQCGCFGYWDQVGLQEHAYYSLMHCPRYGPWQLLVRAVAATVTQMSRQMPLRQHYSFPMLQQQQTE